MKQTTSTDEEQKRKKSFAAFQIVDENNCGEFYCLKQANQSPALPGNNLMHFL